VFCVAQNVSLLVPAVLLYDDAIQRIRKERERDDDVFITTNKNCETRDAVFYALSMLREYFVFINIIIIIIIIIIRNPITTPGGVPSQPASETVPRLFTTGGLFSAQTIRPEICPERTSETSLEEESILTRRRGDSKSTRSRAERSEQQHDALRDGEFRRERREREKSFSRRGRRRKRRGREEIDYID